MSVVVDKDLNTGVVTIHGNSAKLVLSEADAHRLARYLFVVLSTPIPKPMGYDRKGQMVLL